MDNNKINSIKTHEIIDKIIIVLKATGMWQIEEQSYFRKLGKKLVVFTVGLSFTISLIFGAVISDDRNEAIFLLSIGISSALMDVKLAYVLWKKEEITTFLNRICTQVVRRKEELNEINKKLNSFAKLAYTAMITTSVSVSFFIVLTLPVFSAERRLPVNVAFPFDWKNCLLFYWMGHTFVISGVVCVTIATYFTIVYLYIMLNCSLKYQVLANEFRNMDLANVAIINDFPIKMQEKLHLQALIRLIEKHRELYG